MTAALTAVTLTFRPSKVKRFLLTCSVSFHWYQCCVSLQFGLIRIRGSMPLTNGSGSGSCYFRHWPSRCLLFFMMIEGSGSGSRRPKNIRIWRVRIRIRIRIRNTDRYLAAYYYHVRCPMMCKTWNPSHRSRRMAAWSAIYQLPLCFAVLASSRYLAADLEKHCGSRSRSRFFLWIWMI